MKVADRVGCFGTAETEELLSDGIGAVQFELQ
jgi:hypothetical protein